MSAPFTGGDTILIVDDFQPNRLVLRGALRAAGYRVLQAENGQEALRVAHDERPDLILLDVMMPGMDGFETCRRLKADEVTRAIPVVFTTSRDESKSVVEGFRAGGADYISKPFSNEELLVRIDTQLKLGHLLTELKRKNYELEGEVARRRALHQERDQLADQLSRLSVHEAKRWGVEGFVGNSETLRKILGEIGRLQQAGTTSVLVQGESGTGKELVARAIHFGSPRAEGPFVPVNCSAVPRELAESLFFGHVRGSFTGADRDRAGYFELAHGGTLFLDEIGDMPLELQATLLRVLEDGKVLPVGAGQERAVDVRVIAATNADLQDQVEVNNFRRDLYFRLATFLIEVPPLRNRTEDIAPLVDYFLDMLAVEMGKSKPTFSDMALEALSSYEFPGNVRELKNIVERALIESAGAEIGPEHLNLRRARARAMVSPQMQRELVESLPLNLAEAELAVVNKALAEVGGNITKAARLLGVERTKVYRILAKGERIEVRAGE
jgi:DNA-binding NtrC family response regulator